MNRRLLRDGTSVSEIGLGCWAIGGPFRDSNGWMGYGNVDDADSIRCLQRADELGVNWFDTSNVYGCGHSERLLGQVFGPRTDIVISGKFGYTFDESTRQVTGEDVTPSGIREALHASLKRLRRERIDQYSLQLMFHPIAGIDDILNTLDQLVTEGKIGSYAWLTDDLERVTYFMTHGKHCFGAPQLLNVLESNPALIQYCEENNWPIPCRRPLCMGFLSGKFTSDSTLANNDMRLRFKWDFKAGKQAVWLKKLDAVRAILTEGGSTLAQGSLNWIQARSPLAIPCPGFKNLQQLEENLSASKFSPLPSSAMSEIASLLQSVH